jgi:LacI family transcriptional regulator, galactose operon repressor
VENASTTGPVAGPPVTIKLVAAAAGVSRATVSRVMNGNTRVDPELVQRVREAAESLGYRPSVIARSLARGRTGMVAIVVPDLGNPMFQAVLHGLSDAAGRQDVRVLVAGTNEQLAEEPVLAVEARRRCDGLVLCAPRMGAATIAELAPQLHPFVLVNRQVPELTAPSVAVDHAAGIREIVAHLRELGHRRLAYLAGPPTSASNRDRLDALHGYPAAEVEIVELACGSTIAEGHAAAPRVLPTGATAVIAFNDLVALGALSRFHELGVHVPGELSLVGFDDIPFARYTTPPLTTASAPQAELGRQAWHRLWALLNQRAPEDNVRFLPRLEVRGSTGPARTGQPRA